MSPSEELSGDSSSGHHDCHVHSVLSAAACFYRKHATILKWIALYPWGL